MQMQSKQLLMTIPESQVHWEMRLYTDYSIEYYDSGTLLDTYTWKMANETVYVQRGGGWWPIDNMILREDDRCNFYADLFYAIAEYELLC